MRSRRTPASTTNRRSPSTSARRWRRELSTTTTDGIQIKVKPAFWPERSAPESGQFAFMYTVEIANVGSEIATLKSRHWIITDANGNVDEVRGEGVVGKQPKLGPGEKFEYTSWAMLRTPFGTMRGTYFM